ncbi:MAG: hypothetical protein Q4G58_08235 [bacterium]|nr:hypothetical protein [bacterium]
MKNKFLVMIITIVFFCGGAGIVGLAKDEEKVKIDAPDEMVYQVEEWNNSSALKASYLLSEELFLLVNISSAEREERYGYQDCTVYIIFDWSIDSEKQWHYDSSWDSGKQMNAPLYFVAGKDVINEAEVFWLTYQQQWDCFSGCISHRRNKKETTFDYENHTLYIKAKYAIQFTNPNQEYKWSSSDWTAVTKIDKGYAITLGGAREEAIGLANVSIQMGDTGTDPFLTFTCTNTKELCKELVKLRALSGEDFQLEAQIRYNGGEWEEAHVVNGVSPFLYSKRMVQLPKGYVMDPHGVQLRVRYHYDGNKVRGLKEYISSWSEVITVGEDYWKESCEADSLKMQERNARHYSVCLSILLMLLAVVMTILFIVHPRENKRK